MTVDKLISNLNETVRKYAASKDALTVEYYSDKRIASWTVEFKLIRVQFMLTKKEKLFLPVSTLFCHVFLDKNDYCYYHISELCEYLGLDDFRCYIFPYIENAERLNNCFNVIAGFLDENESGIDALALESDTYKEKKIADAKKVLKQKDPGAYIDEEDVYYGTMLINYNSLMLMRLSKHPAYIAFLKGDYQRALKKYSKIKRLFSYERRLVDFISSLRGHYDAITPECSSYFNAEEIFGNESVLKAFVLSVVIGVAAFSLLFALIIVLMNICYISGTLYADTIPVTHAVLLGALPGLFIGIRYTTKMAGIIQKKRKQAEELEGILVSRRLSKTIIVLCVILTVILVALLFRVGRPTIRAFEDHFQYSEFNSFFSGYEKYDYEEVKSVYHIEGRYNYRGEFINRDSFVIVLADGKMIDTDSFNDDSVSSVEKSLIPLFNKEVVNVRSKEDIG